MIERAIKCFEKTANLPQFPRVINVLFSASAELLKELQSNSQLTEVQLQEQHDVIIVGTVLYALVYEMKVCLNQNIAEYGSSKNDPDPWLRNDAYGLKYRQSV